MPRSSRKGETSWFHLHPSKTRRPTLVRHEIRDFYSFPHFQFGSGFLLSKSHDYARPTAVLNLPFTTYCIEISHHWPKRLKGKENKLEFITKEQEFVFSTRTETEDNIKSINDSP
jgi:hypothetical protein